MKQAFCGVILSVAALASAACVSPNPVATGRIADGADVDAVVRRFSGDKEKVLAIALADFGIRVATSAGESAVQLWDGETGEPVGAPLQLGGWAFQDLIFSKDGSRLVSVEWGGQAEGNSDIVRLWNAKTGVSLGSPLLILDKSENIIFSDSAKRVVIISCVYSGARDGDRDPSPNFLRTRQVGIWNLNTGEPIGRPITLNGTPGLCGGTRFDPFAYSARLSPDEDYLVIQSHDEASVVSLRTGRPSGHATTLAQYERAPRINKDNTRLLLNGSEDRVRSARTGQPIGGPYPRFASAEFSPDGTRIVFGCDSITEAVVGPGAAAIINKLPKPASPRLFDARTGREIAELKSDCYLGRKSLVVFSPDSNRLLTSVNPAGAQFWDARAGTPVGAPIEPGAPILTALFNAAGTRLLTTSIDGSVRLWDATTGDQIGGQLGLADTWTSYPDTYIGVREEPPIWPIEKLIHGARYSPGYDRVLTRLEIYISNLAWAQLWDAQSGAPIGRSIYLDSGSMVLSAFSHDGKILATSSKNKSVCLWESATGRAIAGPLKLGSRVSNLAFDLSGTRLIASTYGTHPSTVIWNVEKAIRDGTADGCESGPTPAPVVLDKRYLANEAKLAQAQTGARVLIYYGTKVKPGEFDEVVAIVGRGLCTGTMIGPRVILTAAHCFLDPGGKPQDLVERGVASGTDALQPDVQTRIADVRAHPSYVEPGNGVDIALVRVSEKLPANPVAIAPGRWVDEAMSLRLVGYGETELKEYGSKLRADTIVVSPSCNGVASENRSDTEAWGCQQNIELVAELPGRHSDTCEGDSGGPAFVVNPQAATSPQSFVDAMDRRAYALGAVTSRGVKPSGACGDGGIYVRITDDTRQWISQQAAAWGETLGAN